MCYLHHITFHGKSFNATAVGNMLLILFTDFACSIINQVINSMQLTSLSCFSYTRMHFKTIMCKELFLGLKITHKKTKYVECHHSTCIYVIVTNIRWMAPRRVHCIGQWRWCVYRIDWMRFEKPLNLQINFR